ncbi:hypothetical protein O9992_01675 [Vibrio lentus]|nr:hypothetical protein [Vibrio lentus]
MHGRSFSVWKCGMGLDYSTYLFLAGDVCNVMISFTWRKVIEGDPAHNGVKGDSFSCAIWDHFRPVDFGFPSNLTKPSSFKDHDLSIIQRL